MIRQYDTFIFRPFQGHTTEMLSSRLVLGNHTLRMPPSQLESATRIRSNGIHIQEMQIRLFETFFKNILTFYNTFKDRRSEINSHPMFVQYMFVNLQRIIYDFCVFGSDMQALTAYPYPYPNTYTDFMTSHHHYLHLFKMLFRMAKKLLNLSVQLQLQINDDDIKNMIKFLSRSIFIMLSSTGVERVVDFIFELCQLAGTMSSSVLTHETIVKTITPIINRMEATVLNLLGSRFSHLFIDIDGKPSFVWLQELLLLPEVQIRTEEQWNNISRNIQHIQYKQMKNSAHPPADGLQVPLVLKGLTVKRPRGGSNKKKGSSKKSKKSKKSGRNKKVRANKKSRRRSKIKNVRILRY